MLRFNCFYTLLKKEAKWGRLANRLMLPLEREAAKYNPAVEENSDRTLRELT